MIALVLLLAAVALPAAAAANPTCGLPALPTGVAYAQSAYGTPPLGAIPFTTPWTWNTYWIGPTPPGVPFSSGTGVFWTIKLTNPSVNTPMSVTLHTVASGSQNMGVQLNGAVVAAPLGSHSAQPLSMTLPPGDSILQIDVAVSTYMMAVILDDVSGDVIASTTAEPNDWTWEDTYWLTFNLPRCAPPPSPPNPPPFPPPPCSSLPALPTNQPFAAVPYGQPPWRSFLGASWPYQTEWIWATPSANLNAPSGVTALCGVFITTEQPAKRRRQAVRVLCKPALGGTTRMLVYTASSLSAAIIGGTPHLIPPEDRAVAQWAPLRCPSSGRSLVA